MRNKLGYGGIRKRQHDRHTDGLDSAIEQQGVETLFSRIFLVGMAWYC
jgi:hypothetical protein